MRNRFLVALALAALTGCPVTPPPKPPTSEAVVFGKDGHKLFRYTDFKACDGDCLLNKNPLAAAGAATSIELIDATTAASRPFPPIVETLSSAPSVASFNLLDNNHVEALPGMAGTTDLILFDNFGNEIDRVTLTVADVASLQVPVNGGNSGPVILEQAEVALDATAQDAAGTDVVGLLPEVTATGPITVADGKHGSQVILKGAAGNGMLTVTAGSAMVTIPYQIVAASTIQAIEMPGNQSVPSGGVAVGMRLTVDSTMGAAYGDPCVWVLSDPSLTLIPSPIPSLAQTPAVSPSFAASKRGSFTATCTAGKATATVDISAY
jgi:hypothetical protein